MIKKILNIALKIVIGIVLFYLVLGFIIIPLALYWVIPSQGTKILKTPVHVKGVSLNPLTLDLRIQGLEILDAQKQPMVSFELFRVNVGLFDLLKKIYHVEILELDGLKVNVELLSNGKINLLDLVPPSIDKSQAKVQDTKTAVPSKTVVEKSSPTKEEPLPLVVIDSISMKNGSVRFTDRSISPNFKTVLSSMNLKITGLTTRPEDQARVNFDTKLDDKGAITVEALMAPLKKPLELESSVALNNYAMQVLTPYVGKYTGRTLNNGKFDLKMDYKISNNQLKATHKILIQKFEFGQIVESKDALHLPFGLAIALLEDPQGRISISLPVHGDMNDPKFEYFHLIGQVVRNFFMKLVTKPFTFLASMMGSDSGTEEMGTVRFLPGQSVLSDAEMVKLKTMVHGLKERPKLKLEIDGSYDPTADWKAVKTDVLKKDYTKLRQDSKHNEIWIYERLYERRFGIRNLWNLAKKYRSKDGALDEARLQEDIKRQLIEDAPPDEVALSLLAETRAQTAYDFIIAQGFDSSRVSLGKPHSTQSSMGFVPLEFTLTVFEK